MWHVYIVECADKTFYTGISKDVEKRVKMHNSGEGAKYTRARVPVRLVYKCQKGGKSEASTEEFRIKKLTRAEKEKLVNIDRSLLIRS